jgi:hypothetical protein
VGFISSDCVTSSSGCALQNRKANARSCCFRQGCQMVHSIPKISSLCMFWRALEWKMLVYLLHYKLVYFTSFWRFCGHLVSVCRGHWYISPFLIYVCRGHLVYFTRFGILYQEKYGNPSFRPSTRWETGRILRPELGRTVDASSTLTAACQVAPKICFENERIYRFR